MLVRQSKNAFIRIYDNGQFAYVNNQMTRRDRCYDENGACFLSMLSREPQTVESIVGKLSKLYDAPVEIIYQDFIDFVKELECHQFVVIGENTQELNKKDISFSYDRDSIKIKTDYDKNLVGETKLSTQDFLLKHDRERPRLSSLQFELSTRCNERCIHCYIPNYKKNAGLDLSFDRFKYVLDQFVEMGGFEVIFSGGEALLNKDIHRMLAYSRENDLQINILSNLIALKDEDVSQLKEINPSLIQVSLYSMDPHIHDEITTVKGSFEKTKASIEKLHAANIPLQISCPLMKANKDGYDAVMKYAQSLRVKCQTDYIMMAQTDLNIGNLSNRLTIEETEKVIRDILKFDVDYKEKTLALEALSNLSEKEYCEMPYCGVGINQICVTVNGDLFPCPGWQDMVVGNVYKNSLKDIWNNSIELKKIRNVRRGDFPKCIKCEAKDYCNMCLVRNYNENDGNMFKTNEHFCKVAFLNKRLVEEWKSNMSNTK
jgi:radical SAM protein with 4Fe4S-binding SPASM domain